MKQRVFRRTAALLTALLTLAAVVAAAGADTLPRAVQADSVETLPRKVLRWQLGDLFSPYAKTLTTRMVLYQAPMLAGLNAADAEQTAPLPDTSADGQEPAPQETAPEEPAAPAPTETPESDDEQNTPEEPAAQTPAVTPSEAVSGATEELAFADNGVKSETVDPTAGANYTAAGGVTVRNRSDQSLDGVDLDSGAFAAAYSADGPQVLIIHTHGSEAYTMPAGQEYTPTGSYRAADPSVTVVRIGDEIASVLSSYGISVLHDRTRYDDPEYNSAYEKSGDAMVSYREQYPSLVYILDIHRDAVQDGDGNQYKLISAEDPHAAQISFVVGVNHDGWAENLKLAAAVQRTLVADHPTLMRPISLLNANYNQNISPGSLLVEVGAAGNSLDEAIHAGQLFADGLARTILANPAG